MKPASILLLVFLTLSALPLLNGCLDCEVIESVEERYIEETEEFYEIETYYITEPYFVEEMVTHEIKKERPQEVALSACGDILRIENPSDKDMTITLRSEQFGDFLVHGQQKLRKDISSQPAYLFTVNYMQGYKPLLAIGSEYTIKPKSNVDLRFTGLPEEDSILCTDEKRMPCETYEDCAEGTGNNIFDLEKIKEQDITVIDPKVTGYTLTEERLEEVKKYRKVPKNRTVIIERQVLTPQNITIRRKVCS